MIELLELLPKIIRVLSSSVKTNRRHYWCVVKFHSC